MMNSSPSIIQYILGTLTLVAGFLVVLGRNPIVNAIALMGTLFATGLLYFSLGADFIGVVQILIYAGAVSVLIIFIVMLLDLKPSHIRIPGRGPVHVMSIVVSIVFFIGAILSVLPVLKSLGAVDSLGSFDEALSQAPEAISMQLLSKYMIPFQATALLLLAAVMGVVVLGKKNMLSERKGADRK